MDLAFLITSVSIYYGTQSDIRVKKLLSFAFATSFCFQLRASRYIMGLNRTSELKFIVVLICYELPFSILSVLICYGTPADIRVKSNSR